MGRILRLRRQVTEGVMKKRISLPLMLRRLLGNRHGQDLVEYALLAGFIALAFGAFNSMGTADSISRLFSRINERVAAAAF